VEGEGGGGETQCARSWGWGWEGRSSQGFWGEGAVHEVWGAGVVCEGWQQVSRHNDGQAWPSRVHLLRRMGVVPGARAGDAVCESMVPALCCRPQSPQASGSSAW
jgi:hypothetical protein